MNLPPLRTVRPPSEPAVTPAPGNVRAFDPMLAGTRLPYAAKELFQELIDVQLVDSPALREFLTTAADKLPGLTSRDRAALALCHAKLLTPYQRDRVIAGGTFGLVLGAYRVLDRLNGGTVGVVFRGEHVMLGRKVAIKVLPVDENAKPDVIERFHSEMAVLASLDHPHIVSAYDGGIVSAPGHPTLHYLVLELITGGDLEQYVYDNGPQPVPQACEWGRQVASGLIAAHDRNLIHRDLKPSNILLTAHLQAKIIDFGLARRPTSTMTVHRALLGSIEFMAPEQSHDPTSVGPAADIYGLGTTLFWVLSGQLPLERARTVLEAVKALQTGKPRRIREVRSDVPEELDAILAQMLSRDPANRPTALEVMTALAPFTGTDSTAVSTTGTKSEFVRLHDTVRQIEGSLRSKESAVRRTQDAVLYALAKMAESQDGETVGHLRRMQEYVRVLADHLSGHANWAVLQDSSFLSELIRCVPLHDIGKIRLPQSVLGKPDLLTPEEREVVQTHAASGCDILDALGREHGESLAFLGTARAVVRSHHERWDGTGYPDGLKEEAIPPAARLVAVADVYDALRQNRPHRPGLDHANAVAAMLAANGQFDPTVREAFKACEKLFEEIEMTIPE